MWRADLNPLIAALHVARLLVVALHVIGAGPCRTGTSTLARRGTTQLLDPILYSRGKI